MMRRTSKLIAVAMAAVITLGLSACMPFDLLPSGPSATSTPTGEDVDAALEPFYTQVLVWESCGANQCTTATAPLDWDDPAAGEIELALVRQPATGDKVGSLLVNPGGPGGSGYDFIADSVDYATSERLQEAYDVVGFDPRGVGRSSAVSCLEPAEMDDYLYGIIDAPRGSDEWIAAARESATAFGEACAENTGALLGQVDTISAARDMDLLRAILGDEKLNFLGYSYGTFLGATYAELYPEKVGRLVLDGAIDPAATNAEVSGAQAEGFEGALRAYLTFCLDQDECSFDGTADEAMATVRALLDSVAANPIRATDGRMLGADSLLTAIIYPLYSQSSWYALDSLFESVFAGEADYAFYLADLYNGRDESGQYVDNSTESFSAINCLDYEYQDDVAVMREKAAAIEAQAPYMGTFMTYGDIGCASWPYTGDRPRAEIHAAGADPIIVIGTTNDPATPYQWAVALADQLESGHLITYEGEGHTAYNKSNACVDDAVDAYFLEGTVPASDPTC
ncbi:alpha/beta hydrolase [Agromyces atrinae]|uniref:Alpha/beta hydrolase n=1 Tax=Agromyces atrinae TaxID=592376 RepID=A0A4Q2M2F2_9MICO|nr:alpha/beta hydrolase [Agromyces atrinae]NYD68556.1 pimeloyl-ACP methyl ester carboxylesterase [Agromyces atrinae]RXZ85938.1 alpha/beta hydrolase [Agromyces atrinae]